MSDAFPQRRQPSLQGVTVSFFLYNADGFPANHLGRWQIRLAQAETDVARLRAIRDLANRTLFDSA
jgi:hypothetical protein